MLIRNSLVGNGTKVLICKREPKRECPEKAILWFRFAPGFRGFFSEIFPDISLFSPQMAATALRHLCRLAPKAVSSAALPLRQTQGYQVAGIRRASTYRAAVLKEFGQDLEVQELKRRKIKKQEVRNRYLLFGVTFCRHSCFLGLFSVCHCFVIVFEFSFYLDIESYHYDCILYHHLSLCLSVSFCLSLSLVVL